MDGVHVDKCDYFQPKLVLFENVSIIFLVVKKTNIIVLFWTSVP